MFRWFLSLRAQRSLARIVHDQGEALHQVSLQLRQLREHLDVTAGQVNKLRGMVTGGTHGVSKRETTPVDTIPFGDKESLRRVAGIGKPKPQG